MTVSYYIEDIFVEFIEICSHNGISMQSQDRSAAYGFYQNIIQGDQLTENQGKYVIKILFKYRNVVRPHFDYEDRLESPVWKKPFRVIDLSKKVWVELNNERLPQVGFKFPYQYKEIFESEFKSWSETGNVRSTWDRNRKVRLVQLYEVNLIQIYEFAKTNEFEIEDSFMEALSAVEEIWQKPEQVLKKSILNNGRVELVNATEDAVNYFESNKKNNVSNDVLLAKSMGYVLEKKPKNLAEKIAATPTNTFWIKTCEEFLELAYQTSGKIAIILDRSRESLPWIKDFAKIIDNSGFDKKDFRVCFRASNEIDPDFNKWVSKNKFGGKIDTAKFLIFQHKPAKWLFNGENDVTIVASNDLLPSTNSTTKAMFYRHPCVVYIGDYKPTTQKDDIVEL